MDENPSQCPVCEGPMKDWQNVPPWQPIETAPKDGTKVLLTGPHDANGKYMEVCGYWRGKFPVVWMDGHGEPTHWMPLPEPPK